MKLLSFFFQWRHFGAEYVDMHVDYSGKGVDQLANVIHLIRFHYRVTQKKCTIMILSSNLF